MIDLLDLSNWKTKREILKEIKMHGARADERAWRLYVEWHNKQFCEGVFDDYIAHSSKGYKLTRDAAEISKSAKDLRTRALNLLKKCSEAEKAVERLNQPKLL